MQPRLPLLLLPRQGRAVRRPAGRDERRAAGTLRETIYRGQRGSDGAVLLARRRAAAAGGGFLPEGDGLPAKIRRWQEDREHPPDQRHAGRRGVVRPLCREQFSGGDFARRAAGHSRRVPPDEGRPAHFRAGDADDRNVPAQRRGVQYAERGEPSVRGAWRGDLPLLPRHGAQPVHAVPACRGACRRQARVPPPADRLARPRGGAAGRVVRDGRGIRAFPLRRV